MLERITPVILTYNEAPNIGRTLDKLGWAKDILVVDSGSDDGTQAIVQGFGNARLVSHAFENHGAQWAFAVGHPSIQSDWVLRLDADYVLSDTLIEELRGLTPAEDTAGYRIAFDFCVYGKQLRSTIYPPNSILFRHGKGQCRQDGHTERWQIDGPVVALRGRIQHDDRKPIAHWLVAQRNYLLLERDKLLAADPSELDWVDRLRLKRYLAPFAMLAYMLFAKRLILDGGPGFYYAFQRSLAEMALSLYLIERDLSQKTEP